MLFFFFNEMLSADPLFQQAFQRICFDKLISEGYCDMNPLMDRPRQRKDEIALQLSRLESPLAGLFGQPYAKDVEEAAGQVVPALEKIRRKREELYDFEMFSLIYYVYRAFSSFKKREDATRSMLDYWQISFRESALGRGGAGRNISLRISEGIVYDENAISLYVIKDLPGYMRMLDGCAGREDKIFFRGHSDIAYRLVPSVFRKKEWLVNEKKMYQELMIHCAEEFDGMKNHLERLAEMQHYGLPTRLLDITQSPLVALYFACENTDVYAGEVVLISVPREEIKYPQSDTVAVLASLPLFDEKTQRFFLESSLDPSLSLNRFNEKILRLAQEVRTERPGFRGEIRPEDLRRNILVLPARNNKRIIRQEGAFIICGLLEEVYLDPAKPNSLTSLRARAADGRRIVCAVIGKENILKQLNALSVNKARIYPEIDDVADYIKNHVEDL